jgi:hypothetical protein
MFEGLGFRILAVLVTVLTVVLGVVCAVAGWVRVLDQSRAASMKIPYALYTLTISVLFQLAGLLVLLRIPYDLTERPIFGMGTELVVWSFFLLASFALCVATWFLARRASGPAISLLRRSSILLLTILGLGFIWYIAGE